jgi:hypothetical protein
MTKGRVGLPFRFDDAEDEQQVPPLRFASVGMTLLFESDSPIPNGCFESDSPIANGWF